MSFNSFDISTVVSHSYISSVAGVHVMMAPTDARVRCYLYFQFPPSADKNLRGCCFVVAPKH